MPSSILKVDSVQLEFEGRKILQDVYLDCQQGQITGLLGRNGSGKSSLLKSFSVRSKPVIDMLA